MFMFTRSRHPALLAAVMVAGLAAPAAAATPAAADPTDQETTVRESRRAFLAFSPAFPVLAGHDVTTPVPGLRVGVNLSTHLALDLTAGELPQTGGANTLFDFGARWFFLGGNLSPYLMVRAGKYSGYNDEGPDPSYRYVTLGPGVEYAGDHGFTAWLEAAPALLEGDRGWYYSFGLGYRFGSPPTAE
jgi:hypothetical protein